jgi:hypothetical protein
MVPYFKQEIFLKLAELVDNTETIVARCHVCARFIAFLQSLNGVGYFLLLSFEFLEKAEVILKA